MPSALGPAALRLWAYISGKSLVPMLQLLHVSLCMGGSKGKAGIQIQCIPKKRATTSERCAHNCYINL